jgi:hypothetical protein
LSRWATYQARQDIEHKREARQCDPFEGREMMCPTYLLHTKQKIGVA